MATFRLRKSGGGSTLRGGDTMRGGFAFTGTVAVTEQPDTVTASGTVSDPTGLRILIGGSTVDYEAASLTIEDYTRERSIASFFVDDEGATESFQRGQPILIYNQGTIIFSGHVWEVNMRRAGSIGGDLRHEIICTDNSYLVEKRLIASSHVSQTIRDIVNDMIDSFLGEEGIRAWSDQWLATDGSADRADSDYSTPLTGDLTIYFDINPTDETPTADETICSQWEETGDQRGHRLVLKSSGYLSFQYSTNGAVGTVSEDDADTVLPAGDTIGRIRFDADNGAGGRSTIFETYDGTSWGSFATTVTTAGTVTLHSSTAVYKVGVHNTSAGGWAGKIRSVRWYSDKTMTTPVAGPQFDEWSEWRWATTANDDDEGNTWTVGADAVIARTWTVDVGSTIDAITFNYVHGDDALNRLAERDQMWWDIDENKILTFQARTGTAAPWAMTAGDIEKFTDEVSLANDEYRNLQYVLRSKETTSSQIETFAGDSQNRTFGVAYGINAVPTVEVNIDGGYDSGFSAGFKVDGGGYQTKTVGILGLDTGKDFYWNRGRTEVVQDAGGTPLAAADILRVTYIGLTDQIVLSSDLGEIATMAALEGGSGKVESAIDEPTLTGQTAAFSFAAAYLAQYGTRLRTIEVETYRSGLAVGQLLTVTLASQGLNSTEMLITEMTTEHVGGSRRLLFGINAVEGPPGKSWVDFFRWLLTAGAAAGDALTADETILLLHTVARAITWTPGVVANVYACSVPSATNYPSPTNYPC